MESVNIGRNTSRIDNQYSFSMAWQNTGQQLEAKKQYTEYEK